VEVSFNGPRLQKVCSSEKALVRKYGAEVARKVQLRLTQLDAAETLEDMRTLPGRCHELKGERRDELAVDLHQQYRLVFRPAGEPPTKADGGLDWSVVSEIVVTEIVDYHQQGAG